MYGNDINEKTTPLEAGIAWATKLDKKNFIGKDSLLADKKAGINRKLVAFKLQKIRELQDRVWMYTLKVIG